MYISNLIIIEYLRSAASRIRHQESHRRNVWPTKIGSQLVIKLNGCRCRHMEIMVPFYPTYCAYLDSLVLQTMSFGDVIHTMALLLQVLYFPLSIEVLNVERYGNLKYGFCRWLLNLSWCCVVNQAPVNINTTRVGKDRSATAR